MSAGRIVGIVVGSLVLLVGLGLLLGGGGVLVAERVLADADGFVSLRSASINQDAYAVVAPARIEGAPWFWWRHVVTLRLEVTSRGTEGKPIFVGLAERVDVDRYLNGVSYVEVRRLGVEDADRPRLQYQTMTGTTIPPAPASQTFWFESAAGATSQRLDWRIEPGDYCVVLMNADGSRGVNTTASLGIKAPVVLTIAAIVLGVGAAFFLLGLVGILLSARGVGRGAPGASSTRDIAASGIAARGDGASDSSSSGAVASNGAGPMAAAGSPSESPLSFQAEVAETLSPALWLVKWFLLIPHFVVLGFLWMGFACSWGLSLAAILFTGRYPRGLFEYNVGVLRWTWRVAFYGYQALGTDTYPPFTLRAGGYPADLDIPYPEKLSRRLALVKWWLLAIPHYLIIGVLLGGIGLHWGGLVLILTLLAGVILLFTSRYPADLFRIIVGANRWSFRVLAYVALMTDRYPPFSLDE
jgi:hypothetical protein